MDGWVPYAATKLTSESRCLRFSPNSNQFAYGLTVEFWVAQIQPGRMIYEIEGVDEATAREAFRLAAAKLSVTTTFVTRTVR